MDEQLFLTAAMENKVPVVEKYLSDGGNPDAADHVSVTQQCLPLGVETWQLIKISLKNANGHVKEMFTSDTLSYFQEEIHEELRLIRTT